MILGLGLERDYIPPNWIIDQEIVCVCVRVLDVHIRHDLWLCVSTEGHCWRRLDIIRSRCDKHAEVRLCVCVGWGKSASPPHWGGTMRLELKKGTPAWCPPSCPCFWVFQQNRIRDGGASERSKLNKNSRFKPLDELSETHTELKKSKRGKRAKRVCVSQETSRCSHLGRCHRQRDTGTNWCHRRLSLDSWPGRKDENTAGDLFLFFCENLSDVHNRNSPPKTR